MALHNDLIDKVRQSRLVRAISNLDRDRQTPGFQLRPRMVSPIRTAPQTNAATSRFNPIQSLQRGLQQVELGRINYNREQQSGITGRNIQANPLSNLGANLAISMGDTAKNAVQSLGRAMPGGQPFRPTTDTYNIAKGVALPLKPVGGAIGGALNVGMAGVGNVWNGKKFTDNYGESFGQGFTEGALLSGISSINPLSAFSADKALPLAKRLGQGIKIGAAREGAEGLLTGTIKPLEKGQTRGQAIRDDVLFSALFGAVTESGSTLTKEAADRVGGVIKSVKDKLSSISNNNLKFNDGSELKYDPKVNRWRANGTFAKQALKKVEEVRGKFISELGNKNIGFRQDPNKPNRLTRIDTDSAYGVVAGFEQDEEGNITFNPQKAVLGVGGLMAGQKALRYADAPKFSSLLDKKPRFEIDDSGAKLKWNFSEINKKTIPLTDILDHKELFKQYPNLKNLNVKVDIDPHGSSLQSSKRGTFDGNSITLTGGESLKDIKSTLLHEIQHAIQEIEGFARGGSPDIFREAGFNETGALLKFMSDPSPANKKALEQTRLFQKVYEQEGFNATRAYRRLSGELEARAVERRMDMSATERLRTDPYAAEARATTGTTDPNDFITRFDGGVQSFIKNDEFIPPYNRGDVTNLEKKLDDLLGTETFRVTDNWQSKLPARNTAISALEDAASQGEPEAINALTRAYKLIDQIEEARVAKDIPAKVGQPEQIVEKTQQILSPERLESLKKSALKIKTQRQKELTFQGEQPVQGGSKLRVKPAEVVKEVSDKPSGVSISRNDKYAFNINKKKLGLNKEQSRQLDNVVETMRPVLEGNKGKPLTKQEIIEGGRKAKVLTDVLGRDDAKQFAESLQASRNLLKSEQSQVGVTPRFLEQLEIVSSHAADAGRRLKAFDTSAEDITIKEKVLRDIIKVGVSADEILKAGREVDWSDGKQVTDFYRKFKPATLADKLEEFRYTNMLSSPNTHIINSFSNFLQTAVLAPIEKTVRGGISFAESRLTGKEQEYFARQGVDYARGYWKALPEAISKFRKTMASDVNLNKPDTDLIPTSTSKLRQLYTTPLRALEASDQFFRELVKGGETASLKTEGVTGKAAEKMAEEAANYRTFRQAFDPDGELGQNKVLQIWDKWNSSINSLRNNPAGKWLIPFLQTPTNILKQGVEYSPLGITTVRGSARPTEQLAKTMIGSSVFTAAYALANSGLTTWDAPTNSTERSEFYAAGLQPYSVKMGDKWVSYSKLGPLSYPIAMASALKWADNEGVDEDMIATMGKALGGTLGFFADQSYVRGIGDIIDAFRGDEFKQARGLSNIPAQLVPYRSAMGWIARLVDPIYRKTTGGGVLDQVGKSLVSQIPFASKSLEPYTTPFGEESQRQFPGINAVSPFSVTQERPEYKQYYDLRQSIRTQNKKADKLIEKIEAGENIDTSKLISDQVIKLTKKKIEAGLDVTPQELETAYLNKPLSMPKSNRYETGLRKSELLSASSRILDDENLNDQQKQLLQDRVARELGYTPQQLDTYHVAKQDNNSKTLYALDQIETFQRPEELLSFLANGRRPINGKILVSDGVVDNLVNDGIISEQLGKELKRLDLNEDGTLKKKRSGKAKKSTSAEAKYLKALARILTKKSSSKIRTAPKVNIKNLTFSG